MFQITLIFLALLIVKCVAHMTLLHPMPRSHPLAAAFGLNDKEIDFECLPGPLNKGKNSGKCSRKELKFPCGGYLPNKKLITKFEAGQIFNVSFFSQDFNSSVLFNSESKRFFVDKNFFDKNHKKDNQGRHNGGTCEFALSYDGAKSFTKIATYHKTCPDMAYNWTIKIPDNAPSCNKLGDCLFVWNWLSSETKEFYQNCADIEIVGKSKEPLKIIDITRANLKGIFNKDIDISGEKGKCATNSDEDSEPGKGTAICNAEGSGPLQKDTELNLQAKI